MESAPAHAGSVAGKWRPRSPRPAAPSSASATAWATTSASLWPASPAAPGMVTPPRTRGRPGSPEKRCTSNPCPTRNAAGTTVAVGHGCANAWATSRSAAVVTLMFRGFAGHDAHGSAQRLHQAGVVGGVGPGGMGATQHLGPKGLGRLDRHQPVRAPRCR